MAGRTNRGKFNSLAIQYRGATPPTQYNLMLATNAVAPTADTNTMSELTEVTAGTGYTSGGQTVNRNSTDFDTLTETDASDLAEVQLKDYTWTASGGSISNIRYVVLGDNNGTVGSREIDTFWDIGSTTTITTGNSLTFRDLTIRYTE